MRNEKLFSVYRDTIHHNNGTHLNGGIGIAEDQKVLRLWLQVVSDPHLLYEILRGKIGNRYLKVQTSLFKGVRERN